MCTTADLGYLVVATNNNSFFIDARTRAITRLVDALVIGTDQSNAIRSGSILRRQRDAKSSSSSPRDVIAMHPKALDSYLAKIDRLSAAVHAEDMADAFAIIRRLVDHIVVHPREKGEPVVFEIAGRLAALIDPGVGPLVPRGGLRISYRKPYKNRYLQTTASCGVYHLGVSLSLVLSEQLRQVSIQRRVAKRLEPSKTAND